MIADIEDTKEETTKGLAVSEFIQSISDEIGKRRYADGTKKGTFECYDKLNRSLLQWKQKLLMLFIKSSPKRQIRRISNTVCRKNTINLSGEASLQREASLYIFQTTLFLLSDCPFENTSREAAHKRCKH